MKVHRLTNLPNPLESIVRKRMDHLKKVYERLDRLDTDRLTKLEYIESKIGPKGTLAIYFWAIEERTGAKVRCVDLPF